MGTPCKRTGMEYFRFHPLRYFGATMLERAWVPIRTTQTLPGHENRTTTEIYLHSVGSEERAVMNSLEMQFQTKVPEKSQPINREVGSL